MTSAKNIMAAKAHLTIVLRTHDLKVVATSLINRYAQRPIMEDALLWPKYCKFDLLPILAVIYLSQTLKMHTLVEIQNWFKEQCNGIWEESEGIKIESCDNPAWWVRISLKGTILENKLFKIISKNVPKELEDQALGLVKPPFVCALPTIENDWLMCHVKNQVFNGAGDPTKLEEILTIFLNWTK